MGASLEFTGGILRIHAPGEGYGSPVIFACEITSAPPQGKTAYMRGATGKFPVHRFNEVRALLRERGFTRYYWERIRGDGTVRVIEGEI